MIKTIMNLALLMWTLGILAFVWFLYQGSLTFGEVWTFLSNLAR